MYLHKYVIIAIIQLSIYIKYVIEVITQLSMYIKYRPIRLLTQLQL